MKQHWLFTVEESIINYFSIICNCTLDIVSDVCYNFVRIIRIIRKISPEGLSAGGNNKASVVPELKSSISSPSAPVPPHGVALFSSKPYHSFVYITMCPQWKVFI